VGKWWSVLFAVVMILCGGLFVVAPFVGWWLPQGVSTHSASVDYLFYVILAITGFFFVLTEALLCVFMYKYASGQDKTTDAPAAPGFAAQLFKPVTSLLNDQHKVEMAWTLVPAIILLYIAFAQVNTWANVKYQSRMPTLQEKKTPLQAAVSARQFEWRVRYPSSARFEQWLKNKDEVEVARDYASFAKAEQKDDVHLVNQVHVIKENPVIVHLSTRDVIHSFNLPHLRVKQDALPGKMIPIWFTPTKSNVAWDKQLGAYVDGINPATGRQDEHYIWDLPCAELCGWGHYRMVGRLYVHADEQEFLDWLKQEEAQNNSHQRETKKE
jgi:cytochrome c oxidase subunit 2